MNKQKQTTLFQSWKKSNRADQPSTSADLHHSQQSTRQADHDLIDLCDDEDDDDEELLLALEESLKQAEGGQRKNAVGSHTNNTTAKAATKNSSSAATSTSNSNRQGLFSKIVPNKCQNTEPSCSSKPTNATTSTKQNIHSGSGSDLRHDDVPDSLPLSQIEDLPGFDKAAGQIWIYPTNYPVRDYQYSMVSKALFSNTLVVLPTGLGKTFVAAVVMYNFYRWYPQAKVVFMAPTKPLVAQQIEACYNIMGIPQDHTAEMTGSMMPAERKKAWQSKRVFFLTPQVLTNDLSRGTCPALHIKCLVVDEAHKALGNHAYCQVVRELYKYSKDFRVLALSATPGSDIKAVQQVLDNLLINHIELRTEESDDIKPYTHERKVEKIVVPLGSELQAVKDTYIRILSTIVRKLKNFGVLYNREVTSLSKFLILKAREAFRQNPPANMQPHQCGIVEGDFAMCMSLYHGFELLQLHGLRPLYNFLDGIANGSKAHGRTRAELLKNVDFTSLMDMLNDKFSPISTMNPCTQPTQKSQPADDSKFAIGHPKLEKLLEIVLDHFGKFNTGDGQTTRIMIFSQFRDSVNDITEMLHRYRPLVKVMSFIGQSSVGKTARGFTQKEQLKVMKKFREGGYNTLVSTCVGEEGLDIGDVDLIICFDAHKSPIRLVQRMGRTGRKREGRIVMLVTEGKEESIYNHSQMSKRSIHKAIMNKSKSLHFHPSDRMVPEGLYPKPHKMHITVAHNFVSKAKNGSNKSDSSSKTNTSNGRKSENADGFLDSEELEYWKQHFVVEDRDVPTLPQSGVLSVFRNSHTQVPLRRNHGSVLSLEEWMPWQNVLQPTKLVEHSLQSRHLVELMEFMDIQNTAGDEEDSYGMEMAMYLNEDDIIHQRSEDNQGSILQFVEAVETEDENSNLQKRKKKRRSETLPTFSHEDEGSNSDEDLPCYALDTASEKKQNQNQSDTSETDRATTSASIMKTAGASPKKKTVSSVKDPNGKKKKKRKKCDVKTNESPVSDNIEKPAKKKRYSSERSRVIELLVDHNDEDFEDIVNNQADEEISEGLVAPIASSPGNSKRSEENISDKSVDYSRNKNSNNSTEDKMDSFAVDDNSDHGSCVAELTESANGKRDEDITSKHFPVLETEKIFPTSVIDKCTRKLGVKTPPRLDDLVRDIEALDRKKQLSPVDILQLIDVWQQEYDSMIPCKRNLQFEKPVQSKKNKMSVSANDLCIQTICSTNDFGTGSTKKVVSKQNVSSTSSSGLSFQIPDQNSDSSSSEYICAVKADSDCVKKNHENNLDKKTKQETKKAETILTKTNNELNASHMRDDENIFLDCSILKKDTGLDKSTGDMSCLGNGNDIERTSKLKNNSGLRSDHFMPAICASTPKIPHVKTGAGAIEQKNLIRSSLKKVNISFFSDEDDDFIAAVKSPVTVQTSALASKEKNDQVNFSQAFAMLNDTSVLSVECSRSKTDSEGHDSCPLEFTKSSSPRQDDVVMHNKGQFEENISSDRKDRKSISENPVSDESCDVFQFNDPEREVNFNISCDLLDFDDDDDIVPPSPDHSQRHLSGINNPINSKSVSSINSVNSVRDFSAHRHSDSKADVGGHSSDNRTDDATGQVFSGAEELEMNFDLGVFSEDDLGDVDKAEALQHSSAPTKRLTNENAINSDLLTMASECNSIANEEDDFPVTQSFPVDDIKGKSDDEEEVRDHKSEMSSEQHSLNEAGLRETASHHVTSLVSMDQQAPHINPDDEALFTDPDGWEIDLPCTQAFLIPDNPPEFNNHVDDQESESQSQCMMTSVRSPEPCSDWLSTDNRSASKKTGQSSNFKTPVRQLTNCRRNSPDESDDSPVIRKRQKTRKTALNISAISIDEKEEEEDFVDPVLDKKKQESHGNTASGKRKRSVPSLNLTFEDSDSADDDFVDIRKTSLVSHSMSEKNAKSTKNNVKSKKNNKRRGGGFIEGEAELSGDASSDESDHSDLDQLDPSFINDTTQCSQGQAIDMQAVYLRSVQASAPRHGPVSRFKMKLDTGADMDVFSQIPEEDVSGYLEDSFCVGSDFEDTENFEEDSLLVEGISNSKPSRGKGTTNKTAAVAGHRRIRMIQDSSSDDEDLSYLASGTQGNSSASERVSITPSSARHGDRDASSQRKHAYKHDKGDRTLEDAEEPELSLGARCLKNLKKKKTVLINDTEFNQSCSKSRQQAECTQPSARASCVERDKANPNTSRLNEARTGVSKSHETVQSVHSATNHNMASGASAVLIKSPQSSRIMNSNKLVILVDSREINATQDMISSLRLKHGLNTVVCQLSGCDYAVSNRMPVERKLLSDFINGANKAKLLNRVRQMCDIYERPCLIVEKDRLKKGEKDIPKPWLKSKYIENIMACLCYLPIKILFTESQVESAEMLAELCHLEARKGQAINYKQLSSAEEQVLHFWLNVPHMTYMSAVSLTRNFASIQEVTNSSVDTLQRKGCLTASRAAELQQFLRHSFDIQMLASA